MSTVLGSIETVAVRIRFAGSQVAENLNMPVRECARLHADWKAYLGGSGAIGGEYAKEEGDQCLLVSLNFSQIAYIEPGKVY
jgi:hypothetical protein